MIRKEALTMGRPPSTQVEYEHLRGVDMDWRKRLERLLHERQMDMRSLSRKAGLGDTYVRDAIRRGRGGSIDAMGRIAKVLDVSVEWLMTGLDPNAQSVTKRETELEVSHVVRVVGDVAAGVWTEVEMSAAPEEMPVSVFPVDPRYPASSQYDLHVRGTSMNRVAGDGDMLRCVDLASAGLTARDGDIVVVRRTRGHLQELTAKRVRQRDGRIELHPDSTDPRWQEPVLFGGDDTVEVVALALYAYTPLTSSR